ncbi:MAG: hypothetical protein ACE5NP_06425 [Anaerolineae bacterium]
MEESLVLMIIAYTLIAVVMVGYLFSLYQRRKGVRREMDTLREVQKDTDQPTF